MQVFFRFSCQFFRKRPAASGLSGSRSRFVQECLIVAHGLVTQDELQDHALGIGVVLLLLVVLQAHILKLEIDRNQVIPYEFLTRF